MILLSQLKSDLDVTVFVVATLIDSFFNFSVKDKKIMVSLQKQKSQTKSQWVFSIAFLTCLKNYAVVYHQVISDKYP